jgi:hypothetical protein
MAPDEDEVGLCARCSWATAIEGERSTFWRCRRHEEEPHRFRRFPELPVLECPGHEEGEPERAEG